MSQPTPAQQHDKEVASDALKLVIGAMALLGLAAFIYLFPRYLIETMGADNPWTSYLYQYCFGFIFFSIGILLIIKTGACRLGRGHDSFWFYALLVGFVFFASLHAIWIYLALSIPVKGVL